MKQKQFIILLFACVLMFSTIMVLTTWAQHELSIDEKRFDLDQNDELSDTEQQLMFIENTHTPNPQLYFMNTKTHRSHGSFMGAAGLGRGQGQMRGVLSYRRQTFNQAGETVGAVTHPPHLPKC